MIYFQQFNFKIKHRAGKKMSHIDYLSRLSIEHQMLHELEKPTEKTFVGQVCLNRKFKYIIAFIYNAYRPWMLVRTDRKNEMYNLHQSPEEEVEPKNSNNLETALRELREETGLKIYQS